MKNWNIKLPPTLLLWLFIFSASCTVMEVHANVKTRARLRGSDENDPALNKIPRRRRIASRQNKDTNLLRGAHSNIFIHATTEDRTVDSSRQETIRGKKVVGETKQNSQEEDQNRANGSEQKGGAAKQGGKQNDDESSKNKLPENSQNPTALSVISAPASVFNSDAIDVSFEIAPVTATRPFSPTRTPSTADPITVTVTRPFSPTRTPINSVASSNPEPGPITVTRPFSPTKAPSNPTPQPAPISVTRPFSPTKTPNQEESVPPATPMGALYTLEPAPQVSVSRPWQYSTTMYEAQVQSSYPSTPMAHSIDPTSTPSNPEFPTSTSLLNPQQVTQETVIRPASPTIFPNQVPSSTSMLPSFSAGEGVLSVESRTFSLAASPRPVIQVIVINPASPTVVPTQVPSSNSMYPSVIPSKVPTSLESPSLSVASYTPPVTQVIVTRPAAPTVPPTQVPSSNSMIPSKTPTSLEAPSLTVATYPQPVTQAIVTRPTPPTAAPTQVSSMPSISSRPTVSETPSMSSRPTLQPVSRGVVTRPPSRTGPPSSKPSTQPSSSLSPSVSLIPSVNPSVHPTSMPFVSVTRPPYLVRTTFPPSEAATVPAQPTNSAQPSTEAPTIFEQPSNEPSFEHSENPSSFPTDKPFHSVSRPPHRDQSSIQFAIWLLEQYGHPDDIDIGTLQNGPTAVPTPQQSTGEPSSPPPPVTTASVVRPAASSEPGTAR